MQEPSRNTQYAEQEEFKQRETVERPSPVMAPVKPIIDKWIKEDLKKKRKNHRTAISEKS